MFFDEWKEISEERETGGGAERVLRFNYMLCYWEPTSSFNPTVDIVPVYKEASISTVGSCRLDLNHGPVISLIYRPKIR